jgi:hypothetical protein
MIRMTAKVKILIMVMRENIEASLSIGKPTMVAEIAEKHACAEHSKGIFAGIGTDCRRQIVIQMMMAKEVDVGLQEGRGQEAAFGEMRRG